MCRYLPCVARSGSPVVYVDDTPEQISALNTAGRSCNAAHAKRTGLARATLKNVAPRPCTRYVAPGLAAHLVPYILVPGLSELMVALWLLAAIGGNVERWKQQPSPAWQA